MKTYIGDSKLEGKGTFAKHLLKKSEHIKTLSGEIITLDEVWKRIENSEENYDDPLNLNEELFLDLDEPSRQINHSCNPNAGMRGQSELFAIRDINPNEEITYDYSTTVGTHIPSEIWHMKCNCGEKNCRKVIANVLSIPKKQLEEYKKLGALQDYIFKQLKSTK
ncbi:MAG: hypothetical protein A3H50_03110 [Candidatus Levybacteria bacterium RIFCSPLOWO2_02_FULL_37_10]|nr:MAG: hypothetical protein A2860_00785 [Candidatus Levybacteria bacterium RIFCSPHIGHO2_01_FULL_37_33]OGH16306.1 MAG: hypothetical protein A3C97_03095 [Candidatus Levybacteria bacterium RIFCSPHIGHO2_02_FULL_37_11]OGH29254.1 MAG: hypothetical protein A3F30_00550 [Candidatus Levybacteria bacterium RIFCSPHIGHO2_12_FULL_37_12]OGH32537.1 MAG: hypothetical protein A2953_00225 [Candidatus Levybacteria bacterium RIFCSPLOWO2_01_FULL_36_54]OGH43396.1 MAG: hypothetical protein A3H50_03110 [Candidatus Lev